MGREAKYAQPQDNTDYMNDQFDQAQETQARKIELIQDALDIIQRIRDRRDGGLCSNTASPKQQQQQQQQQQNDQQQQQNDQQQQQNDQQQQQKQQQQQQQQQQIKARFDQEDYDYEYEYED